MIKIDKAEAVDAPAELIRLGERRVRIDCKIFDGSPDDYLLGILQFVTVKEYIYQMPDIKDKLNESQHLKCCYCEKKFKYKRDLDVEHFRPKRFAKQSEKSADIPLIYFWLAYNWDNLLLSCAECNRTYKGNLFPLENQKKRASPKKRDISKELPTFINPSKECPRDHISFVNETPASLSPRGKKTIKILGLRRKQLFEDRLEHLDKLRSFLKDIEMWLDFVKLVKEENITANPKTQKLLNDHTERGLKAIVLLKDSVKKHAPFSSMAQDFLAQQPFSEP